MHDADLVTVDQRDLITETERIAADAGLIFLTVAHALERLTQPGPG